MEEVRIILSGLWAALMFTYLLGDVMRIFAGDFKAGEMMGGMQASQAMYLGAAILLLIPIVMVVLSLTLKYLVGLPGYSGAYDKFLIIVSLVFNGLTVYYAWKWVA